MRDPEFSILVFVSGSWNRCLHRVLGAFDIRCLPWYEVLYLFYCPWRFRRPLILPILPAVTGFQLARYVILQHLSSLRTSYPTSTSTSTSNPTNTVKVMLSVMCTCPPLLSPTPFLALPWILITLRPFCLNLLITNPHVLQGRPCPSLTY